jgi:uncharacterized membrane protein YhaH (DUF805 family)
MKTKNHLKGFNLSELFSISGRMGNKRFIIYTIPFLILFFIFMPLAFSRYESVFAAILGIFCLIITFIQAVKRCHDADKSGWYILAMLLLGPIGWIVLAIIPGTVGPNRFGDDPAHKHHDIDLDNI